MTILHLDSGREMRGGQWQVLRLLRGLRNRGIENILLARPEGLLYQRATDEHFCVAALSFAAVSRLSARADLTHAHDAHSHTIAVISSKKPVVVARRVAFPVKTTRFSRWKYARPAHYVAVSKFVAHRLQEAGVGEERISVVPDGVPLLPASVGGIFAVTPESADVQKGPGLVAAAAQNLDVPLIRSTDLERDLTRARLFVYVTYTEGLGSAVLLALSAGVPVIASCVGGLPEIIRDGENGLLVENSTAAIQDAMGWLLSHSVEAREMAKKGRTTIEERYSESKMVDATVEVYRKLTDA